MCGIGGILRTYPPGVPVPPREESIREEWLDILDDSIKHRGPDGCGRFRDRVVRADGTTVDVALIHRRMAIIDLEGGHQPMLLRPEEPGATADARPADQLAVVFNGCIYNHRELRKELEALGAEFRTDHSDTEVLLWGWRKWGRVLFEKLEGMFALAIWDREIAEGVLAVDNFSEKPLYKYEYPVTQDELENSATFTVFASTAAAIHRLWPVISRECSLPTLGPCSSYAQGWLQFGWNQTPPTEVQQVGPSWTCKIPGDIGTCLKYDCDDAMWGAANGTNQSSLSVAEVDSMLRESVHKRLEADVPTGVFLSGGLDSALVTKYAIEVRSDIEVFTMRMPAASHDESVAAASTAKHLGVRHHILDCEPNASDDLVQEIERLGLPFADSSLLPTLWLCRAAVKHVKVALGGDGGDDLFMGYQRQVVAKALNRAGYRREPLQGLMETLGFTDKLGSPRLSKAVRLVDAAAHSGYKDLVAIFPSSMFDRLIPESGRRGIRHYGMVFHGIDDDSFYMQQRRFDIMFYLPMDLMRKADTASMAAPLELRSPFLDSKLAIAAMKASRESLLLNGQRKGLLRAVARKYFPSEIVDRPKMGFAIPLADWFRTDFGGLRTLLGDLVINATDPYPAEIMGCELNRVFIRELFDQHMQGKRDHAQRLYALLVMAIWCRWYRKVQREGQ